MLKQISKILERPPVYTKIETAFWNDEYISRQMLKAHLDPEFEGASRKLSFIEQSVEWITGLVPPIEYPRLLDVGCGPGIYAEQFSNAGYEVTGIDFSKRSIDYAQSSAQRQGVDITYHYQDYLTMELDQSFDFATMIYCDYGALSTTDRQIMMKKIYQHLRPGGKFLLDVFSMAYYNGFREKQTWQMCCDGGFWREQEYLEIMGCYKYSGSVTLEQTAVVSENDVATYYLWNTCFTKEGLIIEAEAAGFQVCQIFGDVAGAGCEKDSSTIAILLKK